MRLVRTSKIDVVLGKALRVLPETELLKPVSDLLHRGSAPRYWADPPEPRAPSFCPTAIFPK